MLRVRKAVTRTEGRDGERDYDLTGNEDRTGCVEKLRYEVARVASMFAHQGRLWVEGTERVPCVRRPTGVVPMGGGELRKCSTGS